jgi:threonine dehydratase
LVKVPAKSDIVAAHENIEQYINRTPVMTSQTFDQMFGCHFLFKCENFQKAGAFKSRGAVNAIFSLSDEVAKRGVATHSSGNHAQALARAAGIRGVKAYIVMPENAPKVKVAAVRAYGGEIIFCEPTLEARESTLKKVVLKTGAVEIHPYNQFEIVAGQATAAKELLEDHHDIEILLAPVGGGGLLSGTALAARYFGDDLKVYGCEPAGADDAYRSLKAGKIIPSVHPETIADGLLTSLGKLNFEVIRNNVEDIVTVSESSIKKAMKLIWERMKIVIEPSSAVPFAAVLEDKIRVKGITVGVIISGGNVDLNNVNHFWDE